MRDGEGCVVGRVVGYDRYVHIQDRVEHACRVHAHEMPGTICGPARLTMLPDYRKECGGEVYFVFDSDVRRML